MSRQFPWKNRPAPQKPKTAIYRLKGCGGCDEAIVDLNEAILEVADKVDVVLWPMEVDSRYEALESLKEGEIALSIIHGAVCDPEDEKAAKLLRTKSRLVLAFGTCACFGGLTGLATLRSAGSSAPSGERPYPLNKIINVDYTLPGCPPTPTLTAEAIGAFMDNQLPPRGATLAPGKALCSSCPRNRSKPTRMEITRFRRIHEVEADDRCFLAQGIICLGPVIRGGCGEACIRADLPCRGCFGPAEGVYDTGLNFVSGLASLIGAETDEEIQEVLEGLVDLPGYCYRYSSPRAGLEVIQGGKDHAEDRHQADRQNAHPDRRAREDRTAPRRRR